MARRKNPKNRGVIRDRKTGVVLARTSQHPLSGLFTAIPSNAPDYQGSELPPFNMPDEMKHLLAIHLFDNLYPGLPLPPGDGEVWQITLPDGTKVEVGPSRYRLVNPTGDHKPMGGNGEVWLAHSRPAEDAMPAGMVVPDPAGVPDVEDLTDAQLAALEERIELRRIDEARLAEMDAQAKPEEQEWQRWRRERAEKLVAEQERKAGGEPL